MLSTKQPFGTRQIPVAVSQTLGRPTPEGQPPPREQSTPHMATSPQEHRPPLQVYPASQAARPLQAKLARTQVPFEHTSRLSRQTHEPAITSPALPSGFRVVPASPPTMPPVPPV